MRNVSYNILAETIPDMHDQMKDVPTEEGSYTTNNYWDLLTITKDLLKQDGVLDYVVDTVTIDAKWEQVFMDLDTFLDQDFIKRRDPLWSTTAQLLEDMANAMKDSRNVDLESVYREYGFQLN